MPDNEEAPTPAYLIGALNPASFAEISNPPPVRAIYQVDLIVQGINLPDPPDLVRFVHDVQSIDFTIPITGVEVLTGGQRWKVTTPISLMPHIPPGHFNVTVKNWASGIESNQLAAGLP